jgi:hypothetical protein
MRKTLLLTASLCLLALSSGAVAPALAQGPLMGLYYNEIEKDGRVYVFNTPERFKAFTEGGEMGTAITLVGRAVDGRTLVGENETAIDLYLFKHNLPAYDRATPKPPVPPKYPATKIGGRFYGDFTSKENENEGTGAKSSDSGTGLDIKRFYFTLTHEFSEKWATQFQTDIGDQGARRYDVFVKKAYIQYKQSDALVFRAGSADTPWIPYMEGIYGMRYFEQTITDSLGYGTSADWGLHFLGKALGGKLDYQVSAVNGKGYSNPTRTESVDFEARFAVIPIDGLVFAVGGYSGKLGNGTKTADKALHTAKRLNAFAGYKTKAFGIGLEYFDSDNFKNVTTVAEDSADGFSAWAHVGLPREWKVVARYDVANPSKDLNEDLELTYYNLGIEKRFNKSVAASLAYKYAEVEGGIVPTGNGAIGSAVPGAKGKYSEIGVWAIYDF